MILDVVTPEGAKIREMPVQEVILPGVMGEMGVLPGHEPMICGLAVGTMLVKTEKESIYYALSGGYVEILEDKIRVLAETCERYDEIDIERAEDKLIKATQILQEHYPAQGEAYQVALNSVKKAETRLLVAKLSKTMKKVE